jgi:hypothetical protein
MVPVPTFLRVSVPVPVPQGKKLRLLRFRFRFHNTACSLEINQSIVNWVGKVEFWINYSIHLKNWIIVWNYLLFGLIIWLLFTDMFRIRFRPKVSDSYGSCSGSGSATLQWLYTVWCVNAWANSLDRHRINRCLRYATDSGVLRVLPIKTTMQNVVI